VVAHSTFEKKHLLIGHLRFFRHFSASAHCFETAAGLLLLALFVYAAAFSFAYLALSAGTGALLLFGAVQATMILWGLHKGERLGMIQIAGFFLAVTGLVVLVFPGLSAPPLASSI
jgi:drug/metabolite transporter (DMT)-like permease